MGSELVFALVLGLTGSLGHCFGMCGGISLMLGAATPEGRRGVGSRVVLANLGRITTYTFLGGLAGLVGETLSTAIPGLTGLQGALALVAAGFAIYTAAALLGRAPSPDALLKGLTGRWGGLMQKSLGAASGRPYLTGVVWGFLPCGLVLAALVVAAAMTSPLTGATVMVVFGLGTVPAMLSVGTLGRLFKRRDGERKTATWGAVAAGVVAVFGIQMALRGLAAWGFIEHLTVGDVVLW